MKYNKKFKLFFLYLLIALCLLSFAFLHSKNLNGNVVANTVQDCQIDLLKDLNFEQGLYGQSLTKFTGCSLLPLSGPKWKTTEVSTNLYLCDNSQNPINQNPLVYSSVNNMKKFYSYKNGTIKMKLDTSYDEDSGCYITYANNPTHWGHYLIEQPMGNINFADYSEIRYNLDAKLDDAKKISNCAQTNQARFGIVFLLQNKQGAATASSNTPYFWIMLMPCNTNNYDSSGCDNWPEQIARDQYGIAIYHPSPSQYPYLKKGEWKNYNFDLKNMAQNAINYYNSKYNGNLKLDDFYLVNHNFGWEIWGGYSTEIDLSNISLKGKTTNQAKCLASCVDQECDSSPIDGIIDDGKSCQSTFLTYYQKDSYKNMIFINNWTYVDGEWMASTPNNWYWIQGNCNLGTYPRFVYINTTTGRAWGYLNCSQNGAEYCEKNPACTDFNYSSWTNCNSSSLQSRTITSVYPIGCIGGNHENLMQQCSPPCLESNWQSMDFACSSSNILIRNWTKIGNCNQTIGINKPSFENMACTYIPESITCTNFSYSNWNECLPNGIQNRSLLSSSPQNCLGGNPVLTQTCNYIALIENSTTETIINESQTQPEQQDIIPQNPAINEENKLIENNSSDSNVNLSTLNKTKINNTLIFTTSKEKPGIMKTIFIEIICKLSNLFDNTKYQTCINRYL